MSATVLNIHEKVKRFPFADTKLDNFVVSVGEIVPPQIVVERPNISLYCLDDANRQAIFVETPPEVDLSQAPFYYVTQYDHAQRLIALPYETFHQLADDVSSAHLILVYSTGRCGSTLISQALNAVEDVLSLSEPDVFTQIGSLRFVDRSRDAEYARLLKSAVRMYGRDTPTLALKFRAMCIQIADLLYEIFPDARNLFLYRSAESWSRSMGLEFREIEARRTPIPEFPVHRRVMAPLIVPFAAQHGRNANEVELSALTWLSILTKYLELYDHGMSFLTLRYEDIVAQPKPVLAALFAYCGLSGASVEEAYGVYAKDSQAGTEWSRESRSERPVMLLEAEDRAFYQAVFAEQPIIQSPDFVVPGTLILEGE